jgi:hypothetical protein
MNFVVLDNIPNDTLRALGESDKRIITLPKTAGRWTVLS